MATNNSGLPKITAWFDGYALRRRVKYYPVALHRKYSKLAYGIHTRDFS